MRIGYFLLAACLLLSGCSTSTQVMRRGFAIAQEAPSSPNVILVKAPSSNARVSHVPVLAPHLTAPCIAAQKRTKPQIPNKLRKRVISLLLQPHDLPFPMNFVTHSPRYTAAQRTLQQKAALDKAGCACVGMIVLGVLLTLGIALLWKAIFHTAMNFYAMILIAVVLTLLLIFLAEDSM